VTDNPNCTVERRCSSTGVRCGADDRACQSAAVARGLEISCERTSSVAAESPSYVYCPPGAAQRDSAVVWILLVVACAIAGVGGLTALVVFRRKLAEAPPADHSQQ
jgi:hypothetical protein